MTLTSKGMSRILINAKYIIKVNESWFSDGKYVIKRSWESGKATSCFLHIIHLLEKTNSKRSKSWFKKWNFDLDLPVLCSEDLHSQISSVFCLKGRHLHHLRLAALFCYDVTFFGITKPCLVEKLSPRTMIIYFISVR